MERSFFFKIFVICPVFFLHSSLFCDVTPGLIERFLRRYFKSYIVVHGEYLKALKEYQACKCTPEDQRDDCWQGLLIAKQKIYKDAYLEFALFVRASLGEKIRCKNKDLLKAIKSVCRGCPEDEDELKVVLQKQLQPAAQAGGLKGQVGVSAVPIEVLWEAFILYLQKVYEKREGENRKVVFLFFLSQFDELREWCFDYSHLLAGRVLKYICSFKKYNFSSVKDLPIYDFLVEYFNFFYRINNKLLEAKKWFLFYRDALEEKRATCWECELEKKYRDWQKVKKRHALLLADSLDYEGYKKLEKTSRLCEQLKQLYLDHKSIPESGRLWEKMCERKWRVYEDAHWKFTFVDRSSLSYKLQIKSKPILKIIDRVCAHRRYNDEDRELLGIILERQVRKTKLSGQEGGTMVRPIGAFYNDFIYFLNRTFKKRIRAESIVIAHFFLNQFTKIRKYLLYRISQSPHIWGLTRFPAEYIRTLNESLFSCFNKSWVRQDLPVCTSEKYVRANDQLMLKKMEEKRKRRLRRQKQ